MVRLGIDRTREWFLMATLAALMAPAGRAADSLNFYKNYFVTGDYTVAGVGLRGTGVNGWATGTITITGVPCTSGVGALTFEPCSTKGAVASDIVAAFLYWQTEEDTPNPSAANGYFDGNAITGNVLGNPNNPACWSSGGTTGPAGSSGRVYRADVLPFLAIDQVNSVHLANGAHTVKLIDSGGKGDGNVPYTNGASLVVVYKAVVPGNPGIAPLKAVVFYDGAYTMAKGDPSFSQVVGGFYQASGFGATMAQIVSNGQPNFDENLMVNGTVINTTPFTGKVGVRWDNPVFNINLAKNASSYTTQVMSEGSQVCLTWAAVVTSTPVVDSDLDGLLDVWETNGIHLNTTTSPATFGGCSDFPSDPCVDLPAMGANPYYRDVFLQMDWMHGYGDGTGGLTGNGYHDHIPSQNALNLVCQAFASHFIALHFDVGNNYQGQPCIIPYKSDKYGNQLAQGGSDIDESTLVCHNTQTVTCTWNLPYPVLSFKRGLISIRDGNPILNLPAHFSHERKDSFHYVLFAHALAGPFNSNGQPVGPDPSSVSGIADRPGADMMITFGLWRTDVPTTDQVGTDQEVAGTIMHEFGHTLDLSHYGLYRTPNCAPEYQSVMNYMYQTRGLTDLSGNEHIDYSYGLVSPALSENSPTSFLYPLLYRIRYYAPLNLARNTPDQAATSLCAGGTIAGVPMIRLESSGLSAPDWSNGTGDKSSPPLDLNFDGVFGQTFHDQPDWSSLNLQEIGGRPNGNSLSADIGFSDLGFSDLGFSDLGFSDLGFSDLGFSDLGVADGDVDLNTTIASGAPVPTNLGAVNTATSIQLTWMPPSAGNVNNYNIYRCAVIAPATSCTGSTTPFASAPGGTPTPSFTDTVNDTTDSGEGGSAQCSVSTCYNTTYYYQVSAVISTTVNGAPTLNESGPSNEVNSKVTHLFVLGNSVPTQMYGQPIPTPTYSVYGDVAGSLASGVTCAYYLNNSMVTPRNVGTYQIQCTGPASTSATDLVTYNAAYLTYTIGTFTITPLPITVAAVTDTKQYDGYTTSAKSPTITPALINPDTSGFTQAFDSKNAGARTLIASGMANDGNGGKNYSVTFTTAAGTITQAPLTATITGSETYGGSNVSFMASYMTFVGGDNSSVINGTLTGCTASATLAVGIYNGAISGCSGLSALNYMISYAYGNFQVNQAPLSVSVTGSQTYGGTNTMFVPVYSGFVNGDGPGSLSGSLVCTVTAGLNAGYYPSGAITGCGGLTDPNYMISYMLGGFTVVPYPATVALSNMTQPYSGGALSPTVTTTPPGIAYTLTGAPDTAPGTYPVTAALNNPNYMGSPANGNFVIVGLTSFVLNGPPTILNGTGLRLTQNTGGELSSAWYPNELAVASGFSTTFQFQITPPFGGDPATADGFAFVIQYNSPNGTSVLGTGGMGGYIGYTGILNSIAVEFDTYQNSNFGDPVDPHIGIQSNGTAANSSDHTSSAKLATPVEYTFADGNPHTATITYDGTTLSVFMDGSNTAVISAAVNLGTFLTLDSGQAFVGFTAATGSDSEYSDILGWTWTQQ